MRQGFGAVVVAILATGCEITIDKGAASGDTGDSTDPTTETGTTDTTPTGETGDTITDPDADGDTFPASVDCNDGDAAINPAAEERCDGVDNDCDKGTDDEFAASVDLGASYVTLDEAIANAGGMRVDVCPGAHVITPTTVTAGELRLNGIAGDDYTTLAGDVTGQVFVVQNAAILGIRGINVVGIPDRTSTKRLVTVLDGATFDLVESTLSGNGAGALDIFETDDAIVTITDSAITGNGLGPDPVLYEPAYPDEGGGILANGDFSLTLTNSMVDQNSAMNGGGLSLTRFFGDVSVAFDGTTVTGNYAEGYGGGVSLSNVPVAGSNGALVTTNDAAWGGGLAVLKSEVSGVLVNTNAAVMNGGGAYVRFDSLFAPLPDTSFVGVVFDGNTADDSSGAIHVDDDLAIDQTSAITLNVSQNGGAIGFERARVTASVLTVNGADMGSAVTVNDNAPTDVYAFDTSYGYDGAATFTCDNVAGCTP